MKIDRRKWVIYWDWTGEASRPADEIVAIFDSRRSVEKVVFLMSIIYRQAFFSFHEMCTINMNKYTPEREYDGRLICGINPQLVAEIATIISVEKDDVTGLESILWKPHCLRNMYLDKNGNQKIDSFQPPERKTTRLITGPVSYELVWDRVRQQIKDKFKIR